MTSDDAVPKLPAFYGPDKADWFPIGGRVSPEQLKLIDAACAALGVKRAHFIVEATVERAERVVAGPSRSGKERRFPGDRRIRSGGRRDEDPAA
jgi:hypothetical protein